MKIKDITLLVFVGFSMMVIASCQNDDLTPTQNHEMKQIEMTSLTDILVNIVDAHDNASKDYTYILYEASKGIYTAMSEDDYTLFNAFANVVVHDYDPITRAPEGKGWVLGGTGKGKSGAMKVAMKLAKRLEQERDFEIHVEYGEDGSFTVWYRYV